MYLDIFINTNNYYINIKILLFIINNTLLI